MRTLTILDGRGTVQVDHRRATVRVDGDFIACLVKRDGRWITPDGAIYDAPAAAGEDLADAA